MNSNVLTKKIMKNSRVFKHQNKFHFVLGSNTELPEFVTSDWKEVEMNEFPVKTAGSGVEGPDIAPPNLDRDSGFKRPPKKTKTANQSTCSNTELPTVVTSDSKELDMNEFPVKSAGSGVEGTAIAPPNLDRDSGFKRPPKRKT